MGNKHKKTKKSKGNDRGNGMGKKKLVERTSREEKGEKRTNNRKTTRKDIPRKKHHGSTNRK